MSYKARDYFDVSSIPVPHLVTAGGVSSLGANGRGDGHAANIDAAMALRALGTTIEGRQTLAALAGLSFGGARDLYTALGYDRVLTPGKLRARYERGDIAARIVESYPQATWRGGAEVIEDEDPETSTVFEEEWQTFNDRLHVWPTLMRADILAGLGHFSIILIGAAGTLDTELPRLNGQESVLYLSPYGPEEVDVDTYVEDSEDPRYGLPLFYSLKRKGTKRTVNARVHWSRAIHVAVNLLDDRVSGNPLLQRVWNRLDDLDKTVGGGSEAFWRRVHPGTILGVDPNIKIADTEITKLKDETDEFLHGMKRFLTLRGVNVDQLPSDVSNFNPQVEAILSLISGATGIPQRILLGSERGELASTQDKENWDERVADRRDDFGEPVVRQLIDRLTDHGALPKPDEYRLQWPEVDDLTFEERANVADKWAGLNIKAGGTVVKPEEIRDKVLSLEPLAQNESVPSPTNVRVEE